MIRFDVVICDCEVGPHLEYDYYPEGPYVWFSDIEEEMLADIPDLPEDVDSASVEKLISKEPAKEAYVHTPPWEGLEYADARDAAYDMANILDDGMPGLIRHDADRDAIEAAIRDLIVDYANGRITPDSIGTADEHYNAFGRAQ